METLTGLRSWGRVPVTQGSGLKKKKMPRYPVSPMGILLMTNFNYDFFKVHKMTKFNCDLFKVPKMTNFNSNLFKVCKSIHREWLILLFN